MILGLASENFTLLISQITRSLPCQTPAHRGKTVQLPEENQIKPHMALLQDTLKKTTSEKQLETLLV